MANILQQYFANNGGGDAQVPAGGGGVNMPSWYTGGGVGNAGGVFPESNGYQSSFMDDYAAIANANQRLQGLNINGEGAANGGNIGLQEMNRFDRAALKADEITKKLAGATGFDPSAGLEPENVARFAASLPLQMVGAVPDTFSHLYEGITRRPVLEGDLETGQMPDYQLSPLQAGADVGYAGINAVGLFAGATGRWLGTAGKLMGGRRAAQNMASGMLNRAGFGGAAAPVAQLGFDAAEEAGEEFTQTYLEDTRFGMLGKPDIMGHANTFERAKEAAGWGALGGGMMSAGAMGVNKVVDSYRNSVQGTSTDPSGQVKSDNKGGNVYDAYTQSQFNSLTDNRISATMAQRLRDDQGGKLTERSGSTIVTHTLADAKERVDDSVVGVEDMQSIWERGSKDQAAMMTWFKLDPNDRNSYKTLENIFHGQGDKAQKLNGLRKRAYGDGEAAAVIGRNPDTKNGGYYTNVRSFVNGRGLGLNPLAYQIVGSDIDGDTSGFYLDTSGLNVNGYVSEMLLDAEGNNNVEYIYSNMLSRDFNGVNDNLESEIRKIFDRYTRRYGDNADQSASDYFVKRITDAVKAKKDRDLEMSRAFNEMTTEIQSMNENNEFDESIGSIHHRTALNDLFYNTTESPVVYVKDASNKMIKKIEDGIKKRIQDAYPEVNLEDEALAHLWESGKLGDVSTATQLYPYIGMLTSASPRVGNPIYRQYAAIGYNIAKTKHAIASELSEMCQGINMETIVEASIRETFREVQAGIAPTQAIEGLVDGLIAEEVMNKAGYTALSGRSPRTIRDLDLICEDFIEVYNNYVKIYNDAMTNLTEFGWKPANGKPTRNYISDVSDKQFTRGFRNFCETLPADRFFPRKALGKENENLTMGQLVKKYADNPGKYRQFMKFYDDGKFQDFFDRLVGHEGTVIQATRSRIMESFGEFDMTGVEKRFNANNGKLDNADILAALEFAQAVNNWIHVNASQKLRLMSPVDMVKTKLGRQLFFGDANQRAVVVVGANFYGKFSDVIEYFAAEDVKDGNIDQNVIERLDDLAAIDAVHSRIADEIRDNNGRSLTLEHLIDINESFDSKDSWFKSQFGEDNKMLDLLNSSMMAANDDAVTSSIGQRMNVVESSATRYRRALRDHDIAIVGELKRLHNSYPNVSLSSFLSGKVNSALSEFNMNILGMQLHDAAVLSNKEIEKATISDSAVHKEAALNMMINGGTQSYIDSLTSMRHGQISMDNFSSNRLVMCRLLADPSYSIEVVDKYSGRTKTLSRDAIFAELKIELNGRDPNDTEWLRFLEKYPQVVGWISTGKVQGSTINGGPVDGWASARSLSEEYQQRNKESLDPNKDSMAQRQLDEGAMQCGNLLLNESWYLPYLVRCIPEDQFRECVQDPEVATRVLGDLHRRESRARYALTFHRNGKGDAEDVDFNRALDDHSVRIAHENMTRAWENVKNAFYLSNLQMSASVEQMQSLQDALQQMEGEATFSAIARMSLSEDITIDGTSYNLSSGHRIKRTKLDRDKLNTQLSGFYQSYFNQILRTKRLMEIIAAEYAGGTVRVAHNVTEDTVNAVMSDIATEFSRKYPQAPANHVTAVMDEVRSRLEMAAHMDIESASYMRFIKGREGFFEKRFGKIDEKLILKANDPLLRSKNEAGFKKRLEQIGISAGVAKITNVRDSQGKIIQEGSAVNRWVDDYNSAFNEDGTPKSGAVESIRRELNNILIKAEIDSINADYTTAFNNNMYASLLFDLDAERGVYDKLHDELSNMRNSNGSKGYIFDTAPYHNKSMKEWIANRPVPRYDNRDAEIVCNQMKIAEGAGGNPTNVGVNGSEAKHNSGIGWLSNKIQAPYEPMQITAGEMYSRLLQDKTLERAHMVTPGQVWNPTGDYNSTTIDAQRQWLADPNNANVKIQFFNPEWNPHGIYDDHATVSFNGHYTEYKRLPGIIARIVDASQEAMVLKRKKKFADAATIVTKRSGLGREGRQIKSFRDVTHTQRVMRDSYLKFVRDYADSLVSDEPTATVWQKTLGFDYDQARIFAQGMTVGYKVTVNTDAGQKYFIVDASHMFNDATFAERWNQITAQGEVVMAEIYSTSPSMISYRINNEVLKRTVEKGEDLTKAESERAAYDAMSNWDDFELETLGVSEIFDNISPIGLFHGGGLLASNSRTPVQSLINSIWDVDESHFRTVKRHTADAFDNVKDSRTLNNIKLVARDVLVLPEGMIAVRAFVPPRRQTINMNTKSFSMLNRISNTGYKTLFDPNQKGYGVVLDSSQFADAVEWGYSTGQNILISDEAFKYIDQSSVIVKNDDVTVSISRGEDVHENLHEEKFKEIDVTKTAAVLHRNGLESPETMFSTQEILYAYMDDTGKYVTGDAAAIASPDVMEKVVFPERRHKSYDTRNWFNNSTEPTRVLDVNEVVKLGTYGRSVKSWDSNGWQLKKRTKNEKFGDQELARRIEEYIDKVKSQNNAKLTGEVHAGDVVAIVANGTGRNVRYEPILAPTNGAQVIQWHDVEQIGSDIIVKTMARPAAGEFRIQGHSKLTAAREAMKNMATTVINLPKGIDIAMNYMTEEGRVEGREKILLTQALFYDVKKNGGHLLYEKYTDGGKTKYRFKQGIASSKDFNARATSSNSSVIGRSVWDDIRDSVFVGELGSLDVETRQALRSIVLHCDQLDINPMYVFGASRLTKSGMLTESQIDCLYDGVFNDLNEDQILKVFHAIDPKLCPNGLGDTSWTPGSTKFDQYGRMWIDDLNDYKVVRVGKHAFMGHNSSQEAPGGIASWSPQHLYRRGADKGYIDENIHRMTQYADFLTGNYEYLDAKRRLTEKNVGEEQIKGILDQDATWSPDALYTDTYLEIKENQAINDTMNKTMKIERKIYDGDEAVENPLKNPRIRTAYDSLCKALGFNPSWGLVMQLSNLQDGHTYGNGENQIYYVSQVVNTLNTMTRNVRDHGSPVFNEHGSKSLNDRIAIPLLPREMAHFLFDNSPVIKNHFNESFDEYVEFMNEAMDEAEVIINALDPAHIAKKRSLRRFGEAVNREYDRKSGFGYIYGGVWADEIIRADGTIGMALRASEDFDMDAYEGLQKRAQKALEDMRDQSMRYLKKRGVEVNTEFGQEIVARNAPDGKIVASILDNATTLTKVLAVWNPGVVVSNNIDRVTHQGIMNLGMVLCHKLHFGPMAGKHWLNQDIVKAACNDKLFMQLYAAYREAGFNGEELQFLANATSTDQIQKFINDKMENMNTFQRMAAKSFEIASGGNWKIKGQMRNFINRFVMFAEVTPGLEFWFQEDPQSAKLAEEGNGQPITFLEASIANNPGKWFVDILGGNQGMSASLPAAMGALNSAKGGDMAQRHCAAEIINHICQSSPLGKFLFTSTISRFPNYSFNVTQRMLNWILPMSSMYYVFTEYASQIEAAHAEKTGKPSMHLEMTQVHRNLKEAIAVDITKMGVGAVAMMLIGVSGMMTPPDDEDKWGNPEEWLIMGNRIGESWWMQDMLGMAIPMATFAKSAQLGKPNLNLLVDGTTQACYSNPIIRVSDAVGFLFEPEGNFFSDYQADRLAYENAQGGAPGFTDYLQANSLSFGLSWVSQFFTPSFIREWYNNGQKYEHSYKRIWQETGSGAMTEDGVYGDTIPTTYADAMIRRTTRRNPILGWLCDMVLQPNTGYMAHEMPYTLYTDDDQRESAEYWSVAGLSEEDKQKKCFEIIKEMQKYSNLDDLEATGFYLDYETKAAVSSQIWDIYHTYDVELRDMGARGELSYTALGNGDWEAGLAIYNQLQKDKDTQQRYWYNFYYDYIKNSYLSDPIQQYRRYNTTYARDDTGEVYATGFRPQGLLPFVSAPGTLNDPEGTAGYGNDFVTVSAVTGNPMEDKRALVPVPAEYGEWPELETWSADGNGNQYSKGYQSVYGTSGDTRKDSTNSNSGNKNYPSSSRTSSGYARSGGGGGGGSRRGGGRSGGSSPNIYSRYSAPNMTAPRTMDRVNLDRPNFDYLRPSFETKGSREAYRREDI